MTAKDKFEYFAGSTKVTLIENDSKLLTITNFVNNVISGIKDYNVEFNDDFNIITQMFYNCIKFSGHEIPCQIEFAVSKLPVFLSEPGYLIWSDDNLTIYFWENLIKQILQEGDDDFQLTLDREIIETKSCQRFSIYNRPRPYNNEKKLLKQFAVAYHLFCHFLDGKNSDYLHHENFSAYLPFDLKVHTTNKEHKILGESSTASPLLQQPIFNTKDLTDIINSSKYSNSFNGLAALRTL